MRDQKRDEKLEIFVCGFSFSERDQKRDEKRDEMRDQKIKKNTATSRIRTLAYKPTPLADYRYTMSCANALAITFWLSVSA